MWCCHRRPWRRFRDHRWLYAESCDEEVLHSCGAVEGSASDDAFDFVVGLIFGFFRSCCCFLLLLVLENDGDGAEARWFVSSGEKCGVCVCVHVYFHLNVLQKELLLFTSTVEGCIRQADKEGV